MLRSVCGRLGLIAADLVTTGLVTADPITQGFAQWLAGRPWHVSMWASSVVLASICWPHLAHVVADGAGRRRLPSGALMFPRVSGALTGGRMRGSRAVSGGELTASAEDGGGASADRPVRVRCGE